MKIGIVGAGEVGGTIATLLESCKFCRSGALADVRPRVGLSGLRKSHFVRADAQGKLGPGFFKQESVSLISFLGTQRGGKVYGR